MSIESYNRAKNSIGKRKPRSHGKMHVIARFFLGYCVKDNSRSIRANYSQARKKVDDCANKFKGWIAREDADEIIVGKQKYIVTTIFVAFPLSMGKPFNGKSYTDICNIIGSRVPCHFRLDYTKNGRVCVHGTGAGETPIRAHGRKIYAENEEIFSAWEETTKNNIYKAISAIENLESIPENATIPLTYVRESIIPHSETVHWTPVQIREWLKPMKDDRLFEQRLKQGIELIESRAAFVSAWESQQWEKIIPVLLTYVRSLERCRHGILINVVRNGQWDYLASLAKQHLMHLACEIDALQVLCGKEKEYKEGTPQGTRQHNHVLHDVKQDAKRPYTNPLGYEKDISTFERKIIPADLYHMFEFELSEYYKRPILADETFSFD